MRVFVAGGGAREHVLAVVLARAPGVDEVLVAPGNVGIARESKCGVIAIDDLSTATIADACERLRPDLVVIGPEDPLAAGAVDVLRDRGVRVFGPTGANAQIEASKAFAKAVMADVSVPTGQAWSFTDPDAAIERLRSLSGPWVVKADGLAAGKGVTVTERRAVAESAVRAAIVDGRFGTAGRTVIIEEFLDGPEVSLLVLTDGKERIPLAPAQDHKRIDDGDEGPNTGGMGAYSPVPIAPERLVDEVMDTIVEPALHALERRTREPYRGVLYTSLALTEEGPKVVEFNCRFGDPEAQVVLLRLDAELADVLAACAAGAGLGQRRIGWSGDAAVGVVLSCPGYPDATRTGQVVKGLDVAGERPGVSIFHAGTAELDDGDIVTAGGRVVCVTALGATIAAARDSAYAAIEDIDFDGMHFRKDIAATGISASGPDS